VAVKPNREDALKLLLDEYTTYDEHVDVVSAFEWLFTEVNDLASTVAHFERFPKIAHPDSTILTPDFTIIFDDGTGIVAEIARIALHDKSVDKLCAQIGKYDELDCLPGDSGKPCKLKHIDVLQLINFRTGLGAVNRILRDRMLNPGHVYKPSKPPCIVQYTRDESRYQFQRLSDVDNGDLLRTARKPNIADYLSNDLGVTASKFVQVKSRRAFINDPIPALYLATHIWIRTIPTLFGKAIGEVEVSLPTLASTLRDQYGHTRATDVKRALDLLRRAGLAAPAEGNTWTISRALLGRRGERDVHQIIADRASRGARSALRGKRTIEIAQGEQATLF
jgi:hypothetical protein